MGFSSVPNQVFITAWYRRDVHNSERFTPIDTESMQLAAKDLSYASYILWIAFCTESNATQDLSKQRGVWALSPEFFTKTWGIPKTTFYRAKEELINKHYLVPNGSNSFAFHERPALAHTVCNPDVRDTGGSQNGTSGPILGL